MGSPPIVWPWTRTDTPSLIRDATGADLYLINQGAGAKRLAAIVAHGRVGTTGWTNLRLEPDPPNDALNEFFLPVYFVGDPPPPGKFIAPLIYPVSVDAVLPVPALCVGIRLIARKSQAEALFSDQSTSLPKFADLVLLADELVTSEHPDAKLYEVSAIPLVSGDPEIMSAFSAVFQIGGGKAHAVVRSAPVGLFFPVQLQSGEWLGDTPISWPPARSIFQADQDLKTAGFTEAYTAVTLRQPIYPGVTEPSYIFSMPDATFVFVGAKDGKVTKG